MPWLESVCHDPCLSECMVIVVPGTVTTPLGSCSPTRIECAIFDRAIFRHNVSFQDAHAFLGQARIEGDGQVQRRDGSAL